MSFHSSNNVVPVVKTPQMLQNTIVNFKPIVFSSTSKTQMQLQHANSNHSLKLNPRAKMPDVPLCVVSSQLRGPVPPYTPVFLDGWKPEALRPDGQVWEDPVESQHKHEDLQVKQEVSNTYM